jgi:hypothetical protein
MAPREAAEWERSVRAFGARRLGADRQIWRRDLVDQAEGGAWCVVVSVVGGRVMLGAQEME